MGYSDPVLRSVANTLELEDEERLTKSLEDLCVMFPRHRSHNTEEKMIMRSSCRKEFRSIADEIGRVRFGPENPVIVLFSLEENNKFRIMC